MAVRDAVKLAFAGIVMVPTEVAVTLTAVDAVAPMVTEPAAVAVELMAVEALAGTATAPVAFDVSAMVSPAVATTPTAPVTVAVNDIVSVPVPGKVVDADSSTLGPVIARAGKPRPNLAMVRPSLEQVAHVLVPRDRTSACARSSRRG